VRRLIAVLAAGGVLLAGCSSSGGGGGTPTPSDTGVAGELAQKVQRGVGGLTSAHLDVDAGALGGTIAGNVSFANGQTTGSDITIHQTGSTIEVITVDGTSYAKLPGAHNTSGKPWVKVSPTSSNEFVRALAGQLALTNAATSLGSLTGLLGSAATNVKDVGAEQVGGAKTEHYSLSIDPGKVTGDIGTALGATGAHSIPVDMWIDAQGRPVQIKISVPLGSQQLPLVIKVSKFDAPVHIAAPSADQVSDS
jgi:hypothetical protein